MPAPEEKSVNCRYQRLGWIANGKQKLNTQQKALFHKCNHCLEFSAISASRFRRGQRKGRREHLRFSGLELFIRVQLSPYPIT